jgi:ketosteroid isomerase-like protein
MTHQQLVDRHYAEINNKDFSDVADLFGSDVVTQVPDAGLLTGIEPFVAYGGRSCGPSRTAGSSATAPRIRVRVMIEGRFTGTNTGPLRTPAGELPPTGRPMVLPFADVFRLADGKSTEHRVY